MTVTIYNALNSSTIAQYEKLNHVTGVTLSVDRSKVLKKEYVGKTKPPTLPYDTQIANWKNGYSENRINTDTLPTGQCTPEGEYLIWYKATFNDGTTIAKTKPKISLEFVEVIIGIMSGIATLVLFMNRRKN